MYLTEAAKLVSHGMKMLLVAWQVNPFVGRPITFGVTMFSQLLLSSLLCTAVDCDQKPAATLGPEWHGSWRGKLAMTTTTDKPSEVALVLKIEPIKGSNELTWALTYDDGKKTMVKNYKLVPVGEKPGRWRIDERNGVVLDARLVNEVMYCQFEVGGSVLTARYELRGDTLRFEVTSSKPLAEKTGNGNVQGYSVEAVQVAELRKK
jgi:hypothetical protein